MQDWLESHQEQEIPRRLETKQSFSLTISSQSILDLGKQVFPPFQTQFVRCEEQRVLESGKHSQLLSSLKILKKRNVIIEFGKHFIPQATLRTHFVVESRVQVKSQLVIVAEDEKSVDEKDKHGLL